MDDITFIIILILKSEFKETLPLLSKKINSELILSSEMMSNQKGTEANTSTEREGYQCKTYESLSLLLKKLFVLNK
jgi:hypothetical protein